MICDLILSFFVIDYLSDFILNSSDFSQAFWSNLISGAIIAFAFGFWLQELIKSRKRSSDKRKLGEFLDKELGDCYKELSKLKDGEWMFSLNLTYIWDHTDKGILFDVFTADEMRAYLEQYNHLSNMIKAEMGIKESKKLQFYQEQYDEHKNKFLNYYNDNFR